MSEYEIEYETGAAKAIAKMERSIRVRIYAAVDALAVDPRPAGAVKLTGKDGYRIRVGNYRIVYTVADSIRVVTVTRVAHRREVYGR